MVTFDAVSFQVPSAWPAWNLALHPAICPLLDTHAVYLGRPGPDPACPSAAFGKWGAVQVQPIDPQSPDVAEAQLPTVLDGRPAMTNADAAVTHTIVDLLPAAGVEVSLSYGTAAMTTPDDRRPARPGGLNPAVGRRRTCQRVPAAAA